MTPQADGESARLLAFSVDTHLLRELGQLLVGRDSTALVELLKNAYDADATAVVVDAQRLSDHGRITVQDNGHGMTFEDFVDKFLRIAGRSKEGSERRSPRFGRKYTGAKGIGRLSAHKLAQKLRVESRPDLTVLGRSSAADGVLAEINWEAIEDSTQSMDNAREIDAKRLPRDSEGQGTLLQLVRLHSDWSPRQLADFLAEIRSTRADTTIISSPPRDLFPEEALFSRIAEADTGSLDPGFSIQLAGELAGYETQWPTLLSHVNWMIEIDASTPGSVTYKITPAARTVRVYSDARAETFTVQRSVGASQFLARIFVRDGSDSKDGRLPDALLRFAREAAGVRLFFEGFRVLPYGAPRNDWLGLDQASVRRESLSIEGSLGGKQERSAQDERTYQLSNSSYFGGVFLHESTSGGLQMVVNREGFLPGEQFDELAATVRRGVDLSVRLRAAYGARSKEEQKRIAAERRRREVDELLNSKRSERLGKSGNSIDDTRLWLEAGRTAATELRQQITATDNNSQRNLAIVSAALEQFETVEDDSLDERAQLRILASLGTQVGAFVHEVNGVLGQARIIRDLVDQVIRDAVGQQKTKLIAIRRAQDDMVAALERQAVYLSDSLSAETRRRRARQLVAQRLNTALRLLGGSALARSIEIEVDIPDQLRTPPMFAAEMNVIFTNLISNAIKGASDAGAKDSRVPPRIIVRAGSSDLVVRIVIENTGKAVDLQDSERWFRPFETTTATVDPVLGEGLGLGLTLTRRIIEEYGGELAFVSPSQDMATAIEVLIPNR